MINKGEILTRVRMQRFDTITGAVEAMRNQGCSITYHQYRALENGKMPNEVQMHEVCSFFRLEPNCWFLGQCGENDPHCYILDSLSDRMKQMLLAMAETAVNEAQRLDIN